MNEFNKQHFTAIANAQQARLNRRAEFYRRDTALSIREMQRLTNRYDKVKAIEIAKRLVSMRKACA